MKKKQTFQTLEDEITALVEETEARKHVYMCWQNQTGIMKLWMRQSRRESSARNPSLFELKRPVTWQVLQESVHVQDAGRKNTYI